MTNNLSNEGAVLCIICAAFCQVYHSALHGTWSIYMVYNQATTEPVSPWDNRTGWLGIKL